MEGDVVSEVVGVSESDDDLNCSDAYDVISLTDVDLTFENDDEYPFNVWIWDENNPLGPVYLDTLHDVVSINVWSQGVNGTFYVSANGKEYKYKVNYNQDENGGWRDWMLSSFDITEPGVYPVHMCLSLNYFLKQVPLKLILLNTN